VTRISYAERSMGAGIIVGGYREHIVLPVVVRSVRPAVECMHGTSGPQPSSSSRCFQALACPLIAVLASRFRQAEATGVK
jgi:hypothetical protein